MKKLLIKLKACKEARDWADGKTWPELFETCHRGDWLLWLFAKTNPNDLRKLTGAKAHCANTVRHFMKDDRSKLALDVAIKFSEGSATREELDHAAAAAAAAYAYADDAYAAYAAAAAAYADDAYAAYAAADAADAAAYAAVYAAAAAAAYAYADDAYAAYAAADAADAAAYAAAYAADAAAYAAAAADAADAADAYAAADAAAAYSRKQSHQQTAYLCRKYLPIEIWNIKTDAT
jgi:hypothetical protein